VNELECTTTEIGPDALKATQYVYENAVDAQNLTIDLSKDVVKVVEMKKFDPVESGKWTFVTTVCTNEDSAYIRVNLNSQKAMMFVTDPSR